MLWLPNSEELVFAAGSTIVVMKGKCDVCCQIIALHLQQSPNRSVRACTVEMPVADDLQCMPAASDGSQRFLWGHVNGVCALACSADGSTLATAEDGRVTLIRVWDMAAGQCAAVLHGKSPAGYAVGLGLPPWGPADHPEPADCTIFQQVHPHKCSAGMAGLPGGHWQNLCHLCSTR